MKASNLSGVDLDWAVAKCEYYSGNHKKRKPRSANFHPSTNWEQGGPIIERERIELIYYGSMGHFAPWEAQIGCDTCYIDQSTGENMGGPTPLIAAMRCYVASKLGDEIDIPEELK